MSIGVGARVAIDSRAPRRYFALALVSEPAAGRFRMRS